MFCYSLIGYAIIISPLTLTSLPPPTLTPLTSLVVASSLGVIDYDEYRHFAVLMMQAFRARNYAKVGVDACNFFMTYFHTLLITHPSFNYQYFLSHPIPPPTRTTTKHPFTPYEPPTHLRTPIYTLRFTHD